LRSAELWATSATAIAVASPATYLETASGGFSGEAARAAEEGAEWVPREDMAAAVAIRPGNLIVALLRSMVE
jgi:hypothetical protein